MSRFNIFTKNRDKTESVSVALENPDEVNQEKKNQIKLVLSIVTVLPLLIALYYYLPVLVDAFTYDFINLNPESHLGVAVNFFFYDTIKILILLFLISSLMGLVNAYFPVDRLRIYLTTKKLYGLEYFFASFFGAVTPFCSCSSIPLFIGFVNGGIHLGVTFSFLITSPLVNEVAVAMFLSLFGIKATLIYALSGILMGSIGGFVLGRFKLDRYLSDWVQQIQSSSQQVAIGAAMHGYVPENFFTDYLSADKWYAVPLAVILAVPMYANAAGIVPVIQVFVAKGVPLGTAIAFMMAVVGLSLPEATLLKKVMKWKLIGIFFGTITVFIILLGFLFNWIL
jgi:hypothetical protein